MPPERHRKLLKRWEGDGDVRYLTISCYRRQHLFASAAIRDAYVTHLTSCLDSPSGDGIRLIAWVVMPNHVHLLIQPDTDVTLTPTLRRLNGGFSKQALHRWRELGDAGAKVLAKITDNRGRPRFWQHGGGYDHNVKSERALSEIIDYIHENPVQRGLCDLPREWRWSSARWYDECDAVRGSYVGPMIQHPD